MRKIPTQLREEMANDPFYKKCCLGGLGKIEWHHNLIYAGRQVNEKWCILPLSQEMHKIADRKDIKDRLNSIMLSRATEEDLQKYPRVNWGQMKTWLDSK